MRASLGSARETHWSVALYNREGAADAKNRITDAISTERIRVANGSHRDRVGAWNGEGLAPPSARSR